MAEFINKNFEVLTPNGFKNFDGIRVIKSSKLLKFTFEDGIVLNVTPNHVFGNNMVASELFSDDEIEGKTIFSIDEIEGDFEVADLMNVEGSVYYTNSVISHNCSFEKSGNTVISAGTIEWYDKYHVYEPIAKECFDHNLWIWKFPEMGKNYIVSADVARGDGADYSAAQIIDADKMEQVAEYVGKLPPGSFGDLLVEIGKRYNNAMIICENNNVGYATIQKLLDATYPKVFWSKKTDGQLFFDPLNWHLPGPDKIPGFQTTSKNRPLLVQSFSTALENKEFIYHSSRLSNEIKGFIWTSTGIQIRAQAAERMNDDMVISLAIGIFGRNTTLRLVSTDTLQANALLDSIIIERGRHSIEDVSIQRQNVNQERGKDQYKVGDEDISWLSRG